MGDRDGVPEPDLPRMTLGEHLRELRSRVLRSVVALVLTMLVAFVFYDPIFEFAKGPFNAAVRRQGVSEATLQAIGPGEGFFQVTKLCFLAGLVASAPYVLAQLWGFVAAGLYPSERRVVRLFFPISVALFAIGCIAAYVLLIPCALAFLIGFDAMIKVEANFSIEQYISLCITMVFAMGLCFELPLVMLFLQATGLVERKTFVRHWRIAVVMAFGLAMIVTPDPSPFSMLLLAGPLVGLFFAGVWGGRYVGPDRRPFHAWMAWPLVLGAVLFAGILVYSDRIADFTASMFAGERPATSPAPER
jgi:sec-independent protein translocase protein TatC